MVITIQSGATKEKIQAVLRKITERLQKKHQQQKQVILKNTFGKVSIFALKTPLEIQNELRNEWD